MKPPIATTDIERRYLPGCVEIRADKDEDKPRKVKGYAAKYNSRSSNLGGERYQMFETIAPGAFDGVLGDDVRALFNHDPNMILARSKNGEGSLRIGTDETGLFYEFDAPNTRAGDDLLESIRRGDVDQSSFAFRVDSEGEEWAERQDGDGPIIYERTIKKVSRLFDVSPVTYPAYPDATVALRSLEAHAKRSEPEPVPQPEQHTISETDKIVTDHWQRRIDMLEPAVNTTKQTP
jgi:HK97 family phage prohead protease